MIEKEKKLKKKVHRERLDRKDPVRIKIPFD